MIPLLLKELEKDPSRLFMETDLAAHSRKGYGRAKKDGLLQFVRLVAGTDCFPCPEPCSRPCPGMSLSLPPCGLKGYAALACCDQDPEVDSIPLTRKNLAAYQIDLAALTERFREVNSLSGSPSSLTPGLFYLGEARSGGATLAVILGLFPDARTATRALLSLPSLVSGQPDRYLVALPSLEIQDQTDLVHLEQLGIFTVNLDEKDPFSIDLSPALRQPAERTLEITLTPEQEAEFDRYQFKSRLPIEITGEVEKRTSNILLVGGNKVTLGDAPFALFLRLVVELFKGGDGCVPKGDPTYGGGLIEEGYLPANGADQAIRRLREAFVPALQGLAPTLFIERYRPKTLRLSTHPAFITYAKEKLLTHAEPKTLKLARTLNS